MNYLFISSAVLALTAGTALAAGIPSGKADPLLPPPTWTGFYAGMTAGYGFGTNGDTRSITTDPGAYVANRFSKLNYFGFYPGPPPRLAEAGLAYVGPAIFLPSTGTGLAQSGNFTNTQSGFVGGAQFGYNYQWGQNVVLGIEVDIQGTGLRGGTSGNGTGSASAADPTRKTIVAFDPPEDNATSFGYLGATYSANSLGTTAVNSRVDWLGTVRGRIGYLWTPTFLMYGAGGFTYGGVYANVRQYAATAISENILGANMTFVAPYPPSSLPSSSSFGLSYFGGGQRSQVSTGWNVGGGFEWMFSPNWSLKAEGIYWNMGSINVQTATFAPAPQPAGCVLPGRNIDNVTGFGCAAASSYGTIGNTRVNYQGVIVHAGVNYHFNLGGADPIVGKY